MRKLLFCLVVSFSLLLVSCNPFGGDAYITNQTSSAVSIAVDGGSYQYCSSGGTVSFYVTNDSHTVYVKDSSVHKFSGVSLSSGTHKYLGRDYQGYYLR